KILSYEIFSQPLLKFVLPDESSMKIYTRTGDTGSTGLFGGPRVAKDDDRIEAYGTVDELNAAIGTARSADLGDVVDSQLEKIQHALFAIGAELATPEPDDHSMRIISSAHISQLEQWIDEHEGGLEPLQQFILPAGDAGATHLHLARAICRRAERRVVTLVRRHETSISEELIIYLNRLSDLLFVLTRSVNQLRGVEDVQWVKPDGQSQRS
ncbi:MAG: cob(I)yrinic acid a,c-diamide adenosyltransferase, partial [Rubripirellula sp.]